jgi:hypothetical protein
MIDVYAAATCCVAALVLGVCVGLALTRLGRSDRKAGDLRRCLEELNRKPRAGGSTS